MISLIPKPSTIKAATGSFSLTDTTAVISATGTLPEADYLAASLRAATGFALPVHAAPDHLASNAISFQLDPNAIDLGPEGYRINVSPTAVLLHALTPAGLFNACQTLRQLLPPQIFSTTKVDNVAWTIPCVNIQDTPRFRWRGHLFDTCRHFFTVDEVKRAIELMAIHKLNVFHWHLTEDQGWRIEIKRYPRLTEIGAWRTEPDGSKHGGFYTQGEIRDVIDFARRRHITIVPEIEMPGHSTAALAAYPELGCTGGPYTVQNCAGIFHDVYCAGRESTFVFLQNVLDEVLALFPSQYIHIGGDECPKESWKACPKCQQRIRDERLKDEHELQSWFIRRIDKYLTNRGRRLVGWDEILEGGLAPGAVVQSWRGVAGGIEAARARHDVIMSPYSHCYLDYSYETTSLEQSYSYEPVPAELSAEEDQHVLGVEGNMWTEWVPDAGVYDQQVYPRLSALAEVAWSSPERDWVEFQQRMEVHRKRYDALGVNAGSGVGLVLNDVDRTGEWTSAQMSFDPIDLEWNVTERLNGRGEYEAIFWYTSGRAGLSIQSVGLYDNGTEIARDTHEAWSGVNKRHVVYTLSVPEHFNGAKLTLRATAKAVGEIPDSNGDVYLRRTQETE